nr:putative mitochondrial protein [Tanacetum cinerariifolium]
MQLIQKLRDDQKCMKKVEPSSRSKAIEDIISIGNFVEALVLNHYVLVILLYGYDYEITYKKDSENVVADALSRISSEAKLNALVLTSIASDLLQQVKESCLKDLVLKDIIQHDNSYRKDK